ncbi:hypothetical protein AB5I41_16415 [Sphingomonas sp. MMS24-JH45]
MTETTLPTPRSLASWMVRRGGDAHPTIHVDDTARQIALGKRIAGDQVINATARG